MGMRLGYWPLHSNYWSCSHFKFMHPKEANVYCCMMCKYIIKVPNMQIISIVANIINCTNQPYAWLCTGASWATWTMWLAIIMLHVHLKLAGHPTFHYDGHCWTHGALPYSITIRGLSHSPTAPAFITCSDNCRIRFLYCKGQWHTLIIYISHIANQVLNSLVITLHILNSSLILYVCKCNAVILKLLYKQSYIFCSSCCA